MSNIYILESQQPAWHFRSLIEAEPGAANGGTLVLNNSSGSPVSITGLDIIGQQEGSTFDLLNRGTTAIELLANNAEAPVPFQFADSVILAADAASRIYYNGLKWEVLAVGGEGSTGTPNSFPIYGEDGSQDESLLKVVPTNRLHWFGEMFSLWDPNSVNFQSAKAALRISNNRDAFVQITAPHYFIDVNPVVELTPTAGGVIGVHSTVQGKSPSGGGSLTALFGNAYSYGNNVFGGLIMKGVAGGCYVRSMLESAAYGGYFDTFTGGNQGSTNWCNLWGIYAQCAGGHNGITPKVIAGEFKVWTVGGGGLGTITDGRGVQITVDGSQPVTNFDAIRGLSISGWTPASGGVWGKSYGIYIDGSIDRGAEKYAIYSLSTSDSLFSGTVRGVINPYGSGWNGSNKFATEDAVFDKIETLVLAAGGIIGSGVTAAMTYFVGPTELAALPATSYGIVADYREFKWYHTAIDSGFGMTLGTTADGNGYWVVGDQVGEQFMIDSNYAALLFTSIQVGQVGPSSNYVNVHNGGSPRLEVVGPNVYLGNTASDSHGRIGIARGAPSVIDVSAIKTHLGDWDNFGNGTYIQIDDPTKTIRFSSAGNFDGIIDLDGIKRIQIQKELFPPVGAQTSHLICGTARLAAGQTSLVVTNNTVAGDSLIFLTPQTVDATAKSFSVTKASGSFTITANAAATAEVKIAFLVVN